MQQNFLQQIVLYKYRYIIGYALFLAILAGLLVLQIKTIPQGLSDAEINSVVQSAQVQLSKDTRVIDLPYHLLQKISVAFLGLTALSVKLPSIIIAALSGIGLLLLLKRWFKPNVALISALLAVTSSIFLIAGRTGTPDIMVIFWSTYILLLATLITQEAKGQYVWKIFIGLFIGLSLYTPLSVYVLGAALVAGLVHPHARYTLKRYGGPQLAGAAVLFIAAIIPLAIGAWHSPQIIYELIGVSKNITSASEYAKSLGSVFIQLADFTNPKIGETIQPAFTLASLVLILLGVLRALIDNYATRTYALLIWSVIIIPVIAFHADHIVGLYVPAMLFMAIGIETLIREWYSLFPRNPYARLTGLLPLIVLIAGVWYYNYTTYFIGYRHSPEASMIYKNDLTLLRGDIADELSSQYNSATIVVSEDKKSFYLLLDPAHTLITTPKAIPSGPKEIIVAAEAYDPSLGKPVRFLVNDNGTDSLRWYVVKR